MRDIILKSMDASTNYSLTFMVFLIFKSSRKNKILHLASLLLLILLTFFNGWNSLTFLAKSSILDVWQSSERVSKGSLKKYVTQEGRRSGVHQKSDEKPLSHLRSSLIGSDNIAMSKNKKTPNSICMCKRECTHRLKLQFLTFSTSFDIMWFLHPLICDMLKKPDAEKNFLLCHAIVCPFLVNDTEGKGVEEKSDLMWQRWEGSQKMLFCAWGTF